MLTLGIYVIIMCGTSLMLFPHLKKYIYGQYNGSHRLSSEPDVTDTAVCALMAVGFGATWPLFLPLWLWHIIAKPTFLDDAVLISPDAVSIIPASPTDFTDHRTQYECYCGYAPLQVEMLCQDCKGLRIPARL